MYERKHWQATGLRALVAAMALTVAAPLLAQDATPADAKVEAPNEPMSYDKARRTAEASLRLHPGTDSQYDYRPLWAGNADLDGDGRPEIIYLYTATQTGSAMQLNELVVMTPLAEGDVRGQATSPGKSAYDDETYALIRASGYADDASVHIPGEMETITMDGDRIRVTFNSTRSSKLCVRGKVACPPEGQHVWVYRWSPGKLTRAD
ncbi:hypothetical protein TEP_08580 [Stenotrophomonas sp. TEPEL]|uniref:hypothetical protein n=1 Tax=Stenotrophomonas sp. TEPEL TaxID=2283801 RepID=UPI00104EE42E|nr:hypothetical protein [Stenotrophomonas sp. TEPEL]TDB33707.1 hypothetical protein TEP_08580 [Stenotrophomonas sp. TEPEL]